VFVLVALLDACGQTAPSSASPTASAPAATASPIQLSVQAWLGLGPHGVGNLGCGGTEIAWTTDSQPIAQTSKNDTIGISNQISPHPKVLAISRHGGTLTDAVPISGSWLVNLEYLQQGQSDLAAFWYLEAVNWETGAVVDLAQATSGVGLTELPWYDAADGRAVWNQVDASGKETLRLYDFSTGLSKTLILPADMSPFEPAISGSTIVFVDNSTDPGRSQENFLGRHGSLRRYDLLTGRIDTLDADPTAFRPQIDNGQVVWTAIGSSGNTMLAATPVVGGPIVTIASDPVAPQTNGSIVVWYDSSTLHFMAMVFGSGRVVQLQVAALTDVRSVFALCGSELYFALPPAEDGGNSTIRRVDLSLVTASI